MIERPYYLDRLMRLRGTRLAKVLTGMRRAGKSGILRLLENHLLEEGVEPRSVISINLELIENASLRHPHALLQYLLCNAPEEGTSYVLIDEAQEAEGIGSVVYDLLERGRFDVYLTGSHSRLVERDLADVMSGRYVEIPVFPLSFAEYALAHKESRGTKSDTQLFQQYLVNGGLPHTLLLEDDPYALRDYLDGVYHTVIRRDVATDVGHEDPVLLDAIARNLMQSIGSPSSANGISQTLAAAGQKCSDDTISLYATALAHSYSFYRMRRMDLRTGTLLKTQEKFYAADLGLNTLLLGTGQGTRLGGLLENAVYLELRRRFSTVFAAKHYNRQICFVCEGAQGREYFQVATSVLDPQVLERTLAPLSAERDNYPKTLLTLDEIGIGSHKGILQRNVVEWMLAV